MVSNNKGHSGRKRFFDLVSRVSHACMKQRPTFSGAYLDKSVDGHVKDSRENLYVRTEIRSDEGGTSRQYVISPAEYSLGKKALQGLKLSMMSLEKNPPPSSVMEDESRLRRYVESRAMRSLSGKECGTDDGDPKVLSRICAQYTVGFGVLEHLLRDERVQDIYVAPPFDTDPIRVTLGGMKDPSMDGTYPTNILLSESEVERMISILRYTSGRPFTEADPVLECDISNFNARATAVASPLSQSGISMAIRKHSHDPWTLLRLISAGSVNCRAAAFLDLMVDGRSTILIAGPRGAGKSSLLGAMLFDVDPSQRIITIEDTPELPVDQLKRHGYDVVGLTVDNDDGKGADKALRTALRLGESVLVLGEVRGPETRTLYEAMSAGTAGSAVLGTFHADSASSVYKRAVNDLGVSPGSFSSTDIVVVCGLVQPRGKRVRYRRVVQISEYVKKGKPGRFRDLFVYDPVSGCLRETPDITRSSVMRRISSLWGVGMRELLSELDLRGRILEESISSLEETEISRPESMISTLTALREAREFSDSDIYGEWKRRFFGEEEGEWET